MYRIIKFTMLQSLSEKTRYVTSDIESCLYSDFYLYYTLDRRTNTVPKVLGQNKKGRSFDPVIWLPWSYFLFLINLFVHKLISLFLKIFQLFRPARACGHWVTTYTFKKGPLIWTTVCCCYATALSRIIMGWFKMHKRESSSCKTRPGNTHYYCVAHRNLLYVFIHTKVFTFPKLAGSTWKSVWPCTRI